MHYSVCSHFTANKNGNLSQSTFKVCLPSSLFSKGNHIFSFNVGFEAVTASVYLCNTDRCNNKTIPYPDVMKQNKLQCFGCDDPSSAVCNKTVQCVGEQDRCINGTVEVQNGVMFHTFGCVSENLCKVASYLESLPMPLPFKFLRAPKCCESSFCNSAWSVKLNVMLLLFGLFTLIVY
ncbi:hypothetical protein PAMA_001036 [Pampus argenteus]